MTAPILPPEIENAIVPILEAETENRILKEVVEEMAQELHDWMVDFIEHPPSPAVRLTPKEEFERYMEDLRAAYPMSGDVVGDAESVVGVVQEVQWLLNDDYLSLVLTGQAPPPQAQPWAGLLLYYDAFDYMQGRFQKLYRQFEREQGVSGAG